MKGNSNSNKGSMGHGPKVGMPTEKAKDFKGTLKRLLSYLKPQGFKLTLVFIAAILSTLFTVLAPKVLGEAINKLFEGAVSKINGVPGAAIDFQAIYRILFILLGFYVLSSIFSYIQQYIMATVAQNTVFNMRDDINNKLARLPLKYFDNNTHGEVLSRVTNDIDNVSSTLQQSITQLITSVITIIGVLYMMFTISGVMTVIALITLPLSAIATKLIAGRSQKYFAGQQRVLGNLNGHVEEMYTGHKVVKAFNHEHTSIETFNEINEELYNVGWKAQFISGAIMPAINFINNLGYVMVCVLGGVLVTQGRINLGDVQAFIQYSRQFTQPIVQTANIANILQSTVASAERVFEVLDEAEVIPDPKEPIVLEQFRKADNGKEIEVKFEHVKFGYNEDHILIEDMNLDVHKGETIAIVGPTGAGKTTLINLLMRFYELNGGTIYIEGADITKLTRAELRSKFGMVLQDTWLFNGTIMENIAYGREGATKEEVIEAAKMAYADHFINTLPEGYDTVLNEEGTNISQGQRQLLTIARAILANPSILILDEATSSVDTRTEANIQKAMNALMKGRTSFVIAHRLSTIKNADLILVMKSGTVIEQGNHEELMEKQGFYADLYNSQFSNKNLGEAM